MPLRGTNHSDLVRDEAPYFSSLPDLDTWFSRPHDKLSGVVPYQPRPRVADGQSDSSAKLLVCHDYKVCGSLVCDQLDCLVRITQTSWVGWLYRNSFSFSHHRIAVPPSGWTNSAHKQGTRVLGTLIFEGDCDAECVQLIVGCTGYEIKDNMIPISRRYAVLLAELAYQRGFDGYLLNFESCLPHSTNHARALAAWILLLREELVAKVGSHAHVIWYDSVIYDGSIRYQNRLDAYNLPFFFASDTLFSNYWWGPKSQSSMIQYFKDLQQLTPTPSIPTKTLQTVYSGVDVWPGRGQYGDGGYCCYRSITYTAPLGFSTALFAPAWTWESATKDAEQNWNVWWENERKFWLGPLRPGDTIPVPPSPEGPFKPMTAFFQSLSPPNPSGSVFYTSFSPGVGYSWFVEGKKVLDTLKPGWTDIDKQGSLGNLVWPWPAPSWEGAEPVEAPPTGSTALDFTDGYNGGNALVLSLEYTGSESDNTVKTIWLPIQSLTVTTRETFQVRLVYKTTAGCGVDVNAQICVKSLSYEVIASAGFTAGQVTTSNLPRGWTQQVNDFTSTSTRDVASVAIGFLVSFEPKVPSAKLSFSFSLGQLAVYPTPPPPSVSVGNPSITGAKFASLLPLPDGHAADPLQGVLTWNTASTFAPIDVQVTDPESTTPAWLLQDTPAYRFPKFVYFNIYATPLSAHADQAVFIGTTGFDGRGDRFYTERACFPEDWDKLPGVRFYVQGVTDRGEVLPWERCATVDHVRSF